MYQIDETITILLSESPYYFFTHATKKINKLLESKLLDFCSSIISTLVVEFLTKQFIP